MGIQHSQASAFVKEMQKWEHRPVLVGDTMVMPIPVEQGGKKDFPFQAYPKMLYRATRADGGPRINGQIQVDDESQERMQLGRGWALSQEDAIALVHAEDQEHARLAANRAYQERVMSEKARIEANAYDETKITHQPAIPETPIKRRGRKPKTVTPDAA